MPIAISATGMLDLPGLRYKVFRTMKKALNNTLVQLVVIASTTLAVYGVQSQTINPVGNYSYKTYREGKGGFVNSLEITNAAPGRFHVSFEGTYLYESLINTFIGVYAGQTSTEAAEFLVYVQTLYPQAVLKRMTASYSIMDQ